jgi:hypothetical protein
MTFSLLYAAFWLSVWLVMLLRPKLYVIALFVTAPWMGLWVKLVWMLDPFKIGLVLSPLLLITSGKLRRIRGVTVPLMAFVICSLLLMSWQFASGEVTKFDQLNHLGLIGRLVAANGMLLLRIFLLVIVASILSTGEDAHRCISSYAISVFVLAAYAILQELCFLLFGNPITSIYQFGLFQGGSVYTPIDIFGIQMLRAYSFCNEPKDLALFIMPAAAYAYTSMTAERSRRGRTWHRVQFWCLLCVGILTFSSSFLLLFPLVLMVLELLQPNRSIQRLLPRYVIYGCVTLLLFSMLSEVWRVRVTMRFKETGDLLQTSREGPASRFFSEQFPRALVGYGVGTQAFYLPTYMPDEYRHRLIDYQGAAGLDSFWFSLLLDMGLPGTIIFGWLCLKVLRCPAVAKRRTWEYRAALIALLIAGIALPVDLRGATLWLFLGLALRTQQVFSRPIAFSVVPCSDALLRSVAGEQQPVAQKGQP